MSSVRFICGTQALHLELEKKIAAFLGMEDAILYAACFDANGGVFEPLLGSGRRDPHRQAEPRLDHRRRAPVQGQALPLRERRHGRPRSEAAGGRTAPRFRMIVTDGVFSMDGTSPLCPAICDLADRYQALVLVDDSHATGFMGQDRARHASSTAGSAAASTSSPPPSARPWAGPRRLHRGQPRGHRPPAPAQPALPLLEHPRRRWWSGATLRALELLTASTALRDRLEANTRPFRERMTAAGFEITARRASDRAHHVLPLRSRRRAARPALRPRAPRRGRLREGLLLPGGAARASRASASSSPPPTAPSTSSARSPPSPRSAAPSGWSDRDATPTHSDVSEDRVGVDDMTRHRGMGAGARRSAHLRVVVRPAPRPIGFFTRSSDEFGDSVHYRVSPRTHVFFFRHPDQVKEVLVTHQHSFAKGRGLEWAKQFLGEGLLTSEGEFHRRQRRLSQPAFHRQRIAVLRRRDDRATRCAARERWTRRRSRWTWPTR